MAIAVTVKGTELVTVDGRVVGSALLTTDVDPEHADPTIVVAAITSTNGRTGTMISGDCQMRITADPRSSRRPWIGQYERVNPADGLDPRSFLEHADEWLAQLREQNADGAVRRQEIDGNEAWSRLSGEPELFGVETIGNAHPPGWQVTFWVLEFVREEPLESELRSAMEAELRAVAGVTDVREEDREVYWVTGSPSGEELTRAGARAVDTFTERLYAALPELHDG